MREGNKSGDAVRFVLLGAFIMAYGWGYRGTVGHEAGAMVPGALLGLALCLGSGRRDWHRRTVVVGLFAAIGWAWGGSLSYMEQTFYAISDSTPDVLYGYAMLFLLGGLWGGLGGGVAGLALTERRSELERLIRPFAAIAAAFLAVYLYLFFVPAHADWMETITVVHFHDGDWLPATIALIVAAVYWLFVPRDRSAAILFVAGAASWWIGYLGFTKFGGLRLGPLHRSESWGGVIGLLVTLFVYLHLRKNRAALMLGLYGLLGGGLAFSAAVFLRHPLIVKWGPFQGNWPQWRFAEDSYGFLMGLAVSLGALRLIRGGLVEPEEDTPRAPLDVFAAFTILVALIWINFRRHAEPWIIKSNESETPPFLGIEAWGWYVFGGALATIPVLFVLYRYLRGDRQFAPQSAFGKGAAVALTLMWVTVGGHTFDDPPTAAAVSGHLLLWVPAAIATILLLSFTPGGKTATPSTPGPVPASDRRWNPGFGYWLMWAVAPVFLYAITVASQAMQDDAAESIGRKRFGPEAYWRQTARLMGVWKAAGMADSLGDETLTTINLPVDTLAFDAYRDVTATLPNGDIVAEHQWFLKNQYTWLRWYAKQEDHPERAETPLEFRGQRIYIAWPPKSPSGGYLVFERIGDLK